MGQIVHHGIAAVPLNMDRPKDKVIVMIVLDLSKVSVVDGRSYIPSPSLIYLFIHPLILNYTVPFHYQ